MTDLYKAFSRLLADKTIAYHPALTHLAGSAKSGLMLNVIAHWGFGKTALGRDGWIYMGLEQMHALTGLSTDEQQTARTDLVEKQLIEAERRGRGGKWHYRVNVAKIAELMGADDWTFTWDAGEDDDDGDDGGPAGPAPLLGESPTNQPDYSESPRQKSAHKSDNSRHPLAIKESINPKNSIGATVVASEAPPITENPKPKPEPVSVAERKERIARAVQDHAARQARGGPDVSRYREEIRPLAAAFAERFGRVPASRSSEETYWLKELDALREMGVTAQDVSDAFQKMQHDGLTIKSPGSISAVAWEVHRSRAPQAFSAPALHTGISADDMASFFARI